MSWQVNNTIRFHSGTLTCSAGKSSLSAGGSCIRKMRTYWKKTTFNLGYEYEVIKFDKSLRFESIACICRARFPWRTYWASTFARGRGILQSWSRRHSRRCPRRLTTGQPFSTMGFTLIWWPWWPKKCSPGWSLTSVWSSEKFFKCW